MPKEAAPQIWEAGSEIEPDRGSTAMQWWTRSQRIRTLGEIPFEMALLEAEEPPVYQRIAGEVTKLSKLGMRKSVIARRLGVDAKTVAKAISSLK